MTEIPTLSYRQMINALQRAGVVVVRQRGSHIRLQNTPKGEELRLPGSEHLSPLLALDDRLSVEREKGKLHSK